MDRTVIDFFGFAEEPFKRTPDVDVYFMSRQHQNALQMLNSMLKSDESFAVLTGRPGTGKSATLRRFMQDLPDSVIFAYILFSNLKPEELLNIILDNFGAEQGNEGAEARFKGFLTDMGEPAKQTLLVIDEAQKMPDETLEELFALSERWADLKIILAGRPELDEKLNNVNLRHIKEKITLNCRLGNLTQKENDEYISYRAKKAGRGSALTSRSTSNLVWNYTKGNLWLVNALMERAVMAAHMDASRNVKRRHVNIAAKSLNTSTDMNFKIENKRIAPVFIAAAAVLTVCLFFAGYKLYGNKTEELNIASVDILQPDIPKQPVIIPIPEPPQYTEPVPAENPIEAPVLPEQPSQDIPPASSANNSEPAVTPPPVTEPVTQVVTSPPLQISSEFDFGVGSVWVVITHSLNVRARPMLDAERIGAVYEGQLITVQEESPYWVRIMLPGERSGWVSKQYLAQPEDIPAATP